MRIDLYGKDIDILNQLKALAEKHNCSIAFGVESTRLDTNDISEDYLIKHFNCPSKIAKELCGSDISICSFKLENSPGEGNLFTIYYELKDNNKTKDRYNILETREYDFLFKIHAKLKPDFRGEQLLSQKALKWLRENSVNGDWNLSEDYGFLFQDTKTDENVYGFKGLERTSPCYRPDIIIKVFADLVCDYLGEPRIREVWGN